MCSDHQNNNNDKSQAKVEPIEAAVLTPVIYASSGSMLHVGIFN